MHNLSIVLVNPVIPLNTGSIARTCAVTGTKLILVKPLGFDISDKAVKRAGLDYWDKLDIEIFENAEIFLEATKDVEKFYFSSKAKQIYTEAKIGRDSMLVFGSETKGLPENFYSFTDSLYKIPMKEAEGLRCLNLANSVNIVLYEALRQSDFEGLL